MNLISIFIFTIIIFFGSNFILYVFNLTNYLIGKEIILSTNIYINYLYLSLYFLLVLILLYLLINKNIHVLKSRKVLFINNLIISIIFFFFLKIILNNAKLQIEENIIAMFLTFFLTTYVFYYSIYYSILIK